LDKLCSIFKGYLKSTSLFTKEELSFYDKYWNSVRVERSAIQALTKGRKESLEIVDKKNQVIEQKEQVIKKKQVLLESAKAMLKTSMTIKQVCDITKLPEEIINKLRNQR